MLTKICECCGKEFKTSCRRGKYCSMECRDKVYKERKVRLGVRTFYCELCGKAFESDKRRKFCTPECRRKAERGGKKSKKPKLSLEQVAKLSREEGLSYGRYVGKYGL